jgi:hypothetical protein
VAASATKPVGLAGVLRRIARVAGVIAAATASTSIANEGEVSIGTTRPPRNSTSGRYITNAGSKTITSSPGSISAISASTSAPLEPLVTQSRRAAWPVSRRASASSRSRRAGMPCVGV